MTPRILDLLPCLPHETSTFTRLGVSPQYHPLTAGGRQAAWRPRQPPSSSSSVTSHFPGGTRSSPCTVLRPYTLRRLGGPQPRAPAALRWCSKLPGTDSCPPTPIHPTSAWIRTRKRTGGQRTQDRAVQPPSLERRTRAWWYVFYFVLLVLRYNVRTAKHTTFKCPAQEAF